MPSSRARPRLDIRLLGPPEIRVDGRPLEVDTRKAVAILALLAAEGRPFARDELAALLWPDADDLAARGALRRTLSTMRSAVGDGPLLIDRARVALEPSQVVVDLALVDAAATATDRATLERAAAAARGTFLAGFHLRDSPEFDDWRATRAVAAERAILVVLDRLAGAAESDGDLATAVSAASRRLDIDPLDEAGHVRLMDLLVASGDRSGALRQYRACVAILDRELGVAPLASTTARYEVDPRRDRARRPSCRCRGRRPSRGGLDDWRRAVADRRADGCPGNRLRRPRRRRSRWRARGGDHGRGGHRQDPAGGRVGRALADLRGDGPRRDGLSRGARHRLRADRRPAAGGARAAGCGRPSRPVGPADARRAGAPAPGHRSHPVMEAVPASARPMGPAPAPGSWSRSPTG